jgi:SAM-dependent methyltransferase
VTPDSRALSAFASLAQRLRREDELRGTGTTAVEAYWAGHTVRAPSFDDAAASEAYLEWRFDQYPLFREFFGLWGDHAGDRIVDYGCGPGNDVTGFLLYSDAAEVVGVDVSAKALELAEQRLRLHCIAASRYRLIRVGEGEALPLEDLSVDYVHCAGVLHHVTEPRRVLVELRRVLRPSGACTVMVYNRDSVYFHLYTAYMRMILEGAFPDAAVDEAFRRNTDGPDCPVSRAYRPEEFLDLCRTAGFAGEFAGGYLLKNEVDWLRMHRVGALQSAMLGEEHKAFLGALELDPDGYPRYRGRHAGIGGVYRLRPE